MATCSKCGGVVQFKSGVSKATGKEYSGFKCTVCDNFDFQRRTVQPPQQPRPSPQPAQKDNKLDVLKLAVQASMKDERPVMESVAYYYEAFSKILRGEVSSVENGDIPF